MLVGPDTSTVLFLNGLLRDHSLFTEIVQGLANNSIARGAPIFVPLIVTWFSPELVKQRGRILAGLLGVCAATFASLLLQQYVHVDVRPFLNPDSHLFLPDHQIIKDWGTRISSFPSDTATLCFSLATVVFLEWRLAGAVAYGWAFLCAGLCRIALGFHNPSDIAGGMVLGIGTVYIFSNWAGLAGLFQTLLDRSRRRVGWIHAALFLFIADAYMLFPALQGVMHFFTKLDRHL